MLTKDKLENQKESHLKVIPFYLNICIFSKLEQKIVIFKDIFYYYTLKSYDQSLNQILFPK